MARPTQPKLQVIMSYQELAELLKATEQVPALRQEVARLEAQVAALRGIQYECMLQIGELKKQL